MQKRQSCFRQLSWSAENGFNLKNPQKLGIKASILLNP